MAWCRRPLAIALVLGLVVFACAGSSEDAPAPALVDPPTPDAGTEPAAQSPPLLRWNFEPASPDCNGWTTTGGRSIRAVPSHSGTYACKLCADGTSGDVSLARSVGPLGPGLWLVHAWVRRAPATNADVRGRVVIETGARSTPAPFAFGDEWHDVGDAVDLAADAPIAALVLTALDVDAGECVLIDDVSLDRR